MIQLPEKNPFLRLDIYLKSVEIGDYTKEEISMREYYKFKSTCKDCIVLNLDTLNKTTPPLIWWQKLKQDFGMFALGLSVALVLLIIGWLVYRIKKK